MSIVVMGVSAVGKSSVGVALAALLGMPFVDGDDLHPPANVAKMSAGIALTDADRWPWLGAVAECLRDDGDLVMACSALTRAYRDRIRDGAPQTAFIDLWGEPHLLAARAAARADHFMPASLLESQLAIYEPLGTDELGIRLDVSADPPTLARAAAEWFGRRDASSNSACR
ncbi:gluconokinase [Microbacterium sediminicola]|uniref:Gluconokinase n=1 Tax=Microbacterium sediminicola TaxID=415210 RepID=A0ABN2IGZ2_9MICO